MPFEDSPSLYDVRQLTRVLSNFTNLKMVVFWQRTSTPQIRHGVNTYRNVLDCTGKKQAVPLRTNEHTKDHVAGVPLQSLALRNPGTRLCEQSKLSLHEVGLKNTMRSLTHLDLELHHLFSFPATQMNIFNAFRDAIHLETVPLAITDTRQVDWTNSFVGKMIEHRPWRKLKQLHLQIVVDAYLLLDFLHSLRSELKRLALYKTTFHAYEAKPETWGIILPAVATQLPDPLSLHLSGLGRRSVHGRCIFTRETSVYNHSKDDKIFHRQSCLPVYTALITKPLLRTKQILERA